jgi:ABC-type sugar transport system substrate-binding protein
LSSASSGCGTVPTVAYHDASGVIASLPAQYKAAYASYPSTIFKSAWTNFKPKHAPPYTIGLVLTQPIDPFQAALIPMLEKDLHAIQGVGNVTLLTSSPTGLTTQIQQSNQLIQQKVDIIIAEPLAAQPFVAVAAKAGRDGIPFISLLNISPTPYSINVSPNTIMDGLDSGAYLARLIGGTGTVIGVHGVPGVVLDEQEFAGWKEAFARCPAIKFDSSLVGEFEVPVAKQQVLTYLSTHPQPVAGAVESATMASAVIQAFQETGRPQPALVNVSPTVGDLAYWSAHKDTYKSIALGVSAQDLARATTYTVRMLLGGHGPKISELSEPSTTITAANRSQWATPGAATSDPGTVEGPAGQWLPDSYLAPLFGK